MSASDPFADSYTEARARFLTAAMGSRLKTYSAPLRGREQETLAMDVVRLGPDEAEAVLVISSGCHGVEGFCGSGVQVDLLEDEAFRAAARDAGVALVFLHALNPWGFSFGRRVTQEGVDLNRNVMDFDAPLPPNAGYDALADVLLPAQWPPTEDDDRQLMGYAARHGMAALQQAVSGGQYTHPGGLFYGGAAPTWSQRTLRDVLRRHAGACRRLGWIDLHSGLGESGVGERIFSCRDTPDARARATAWWGPGVTFTGDGSSTSAALNGGLWQVADEECPQAAITGIALEFGTQPMLAVLQALRLDHWVARRAEATGAERDAARAAMRSAFFTDTPEWKHSVLAQGREAARQAIAGLAAG